MHPLFFSFYRLFFPKHCAVCGALLRNGEEVMCLACEAGLPLTGYGNTPGNPAERLFWGRIELERATSLFFYARDNAYRSLILQLKYMGRKDIGRYLGNRTHATVAHSLEMLDTLLQNDIALGQQIRHIENLIAS